MQVQSATSPVAAAATDSSGTTATRTIGNSSLGQADFLKLLTVQLQQQDPMKPMDDSAFVAQMAQFSSLQQMTALNDNVTAMRGDSQLASASNLIGAQATVLDSDGNYVTGIVDSVNQSTDGVTLTIGGQAYAFTSIRQVTLPPITSTTTTTG